MERTKQGLKVDIYDKYLPVILKEIHKTNASLHIIEIHGATMEFRLLDYFQGETCYFDDREYSNLIVSIEGQISINQSQQAHLLSESGLDIK